MKKLITTLLILFSLASQAQTYKYLTIPGETGKVRGAIVIDGITMLSSIDTLPVPITMRDMHGLIGKGDSLYRYSPVQHKWIPISGGGASVWGSITGLLSNQTDLQTALNNKQNKLLQGTPGQYFRGDLSLGTFATDVLSTVGTRLLPTGGAAGSILVKNSGNNYDVSWQANPDRYIASGSVVGAKYKSIYGTYNDGTSVLIGTFQDLMDTSETIAVDTMYKSGIDLTYRIAGRAYTLANVFNDNLGIVVQYPLMGSNSATVNVKDTAFIDPVKVARWDSAAEFTEHFSESVGVTHEELADSTDDLRTAINNVLANFSNYYTKTESDARFYPLDLNPKGYLTAVPATDDPYRIDSTTITGEDNPRTLTNYYHNGATSSTSYNDFKSDYWRKNAGGDLYHLETNGTGFVGIGTNAPAASMHVAANYSVGSIAGFLLEDKTTPGAFLKIMDGTAASNSMVPTVWGRGVTGQLPHSINNNNRDGLQIAGDVGYDTSFNAGVTILGRSHSGGFITQAPALRITNHLSTIATFNADSTVTFNYLKAGRTIPTQPGTPRSVVVYDNGTFGVGTGTGSGSATLSGLTDVAITSPVVNNVLQYDGTNWKNKPTTIIDPTGFVVGDWIKKTATGFMRTPRLTITTTGTSGAATIDTSNNVINIPNYGAGVALTTTDNYLNVSGTTITTKKAWNAITWASSIIVNAATSSNHTVTLGGTTAISISNAQDGQVILLELVQDATGSRTVTWPSDVDWSWTATGTQPTLKTAAGAPNAITLTYKLATAKWYGTY